MVSAQMGGDGQAAIAAAQKLDASMAPEVVAQFAIMQPVKAAPYTTHAQFSAPDTILALPAPLLRPSRVMAMPESAAKSADRALTVPAGGIPKATASAGAASVIPQATENSLRAEEGDAVDGQ